MAFSATDAAFEGFRIVRERPVTVLSLALVILVFSLGASLLLIGTVGPELVAMGAMDPAAIQRDPDAAMALLSKLGPAVALLLPIALVYYGVIYGAVNRAVLRPEQKSFGYVRLGLDELRQAAVLFLLSLILFGIYFAVLVAVSLGRGPLGALVALAGLVAMVWVVVRLSLASPLTFDRRKIDLAAAWRLTKGRAWSLLGAYLIAFVLAIVVYLLAFAVFVGILATIPGMGLKAVGQAYNPDVSSISAYLTPTTVAVDVFQAIAGALIVVIVIAPMAVAYRELGRE